MGQINCQCQEIRFEDHQLNLTHREYEKFVPPLSQSQPQNLLTRITLVNSLTSYYIRIKENQTLTVGCGTQCQHQFQSNTGNIFKMTARMNGRAFMVRDCGIGLGVFAVRKRIALFSNNVENLLSIEDSFVMVRIGDRKITWTIYDLQGQKTFSSEPQSEVQLKLPDVKLSLRRSRQHPKQYTLRRQDRKYICHLLSEQQQVRSQDILRLGTDYFTVEGIFTCIDSLQ